MDNFPLQRIAAWYETIASVPRENLAFFVIVRTRKYDLLRENSRKLFQAWLSEELDYFQHIGRTIHVRGLIDYVLHKEGSSEEWDDKLNTNLEMLESEGTPVDLKPLINDVIPNLINRKPEWLKAARTWRKLRHAHLTDNALHAWEDEMVLRSGTGL